MKTVFGTRRQAGQEIPLDLSQAPTSGIGGQSSGAFSDRQTDAARRSEVAIFYITGYDAGTDSHRESTIIRRSDQVARG